VHSNTSPGPAGDLLTDARFAVPDAVPGLLAEHARRLGALDAAIFLVDYEQRVLTPLPRPGGPQRQAVTVEGTLAGRAFTTLTVQWSSDHGLLWVPMVEGNERLGVIGFELPGAVSGGGPGDDVVEAARTLTAEAAELIVAKADYGDFFERHRRLRPMSLASELAWQLLPPLTFGSAVTWSRPTTWEATRSTTASTPRRSASPCSTPWATVSRPGCWRRWRWPPTATPDAEG
jgi:hypothetical protein